MTGRTHDLAAFTALNAVFVSTHTPLVGLATIVVAGLANMIGGLAPDMDNASSDIWKKIRGGKILAYIISPLFGGHRLISHSLVGVGLMGFILHKVLFSINHIFLVDMQIVWLSFIIGCCSHLLADAMTKEGIPLFFPLPINIGFPPLKFLRMKTGGPFEKSIVFPVLIISNIMLIYQNQSKYIELLENIIRSS